MKFLSHFKTKVKRILPHKSKKKLEDVYEIKDTIGTGNYSVVKYGAHKKTGEEVALKIVDKQSLADYERDNISVEIDLLRNYGNHPNILCLKEVFEDKKRITLVTELMKGGELLTQLRKKKLYPEKEACVLARKLLSAIAYLHRNGVVHRDLKPENLLFTSESEDTEIKIADFGFARYIGEGTLQTPCGSPAYVAPEIVKEEEYTKSVDIWSLGVIFYIVLCGFPPFYHENTEKIFEQILKGYFDFPDPYWTRISSSAKDLITRMLKIDPKERITAEEALKHPWVAQIALPVDQLVVETRHASFDGVPKMVLKAPQAMNKEEKHKEKREASKETENSNSSSDSD